MSRYTRGVSVAPLEIYYKCTWVTSGVRWQNARSTLGVHQGYIKRETRGPLGVHLGYTRGGAKGALGVH